MNCLALNCAITLKTKTV